MIEHEHLESRNERKNTSIKARRCCESSVLIISSRFLISHLSLSLLQTLHYIFLSVPLSTNKYKSLRSPPTTVGDPTLWPLLSVLPIKFTSLCHRAGYKAFILLHHQSLLSLVHMLLRTRIQVSPVTESRKRV